MEKLAKKLTHIALVLYGAYVFSVVLGG